MKRILIFCDSCGTELTNVNEVTVTFPYKIESLTLCSSCSGKLFKQIKEYHKFKESMIDSTSYAVARHLLKTDKEVGL